MTRVGKFLELWTHTQPVINMVPCSINYSKIWFWYITMVLKNAYTKSVNQLEKPWFFAGS
jgi:hypothetical protein